MLSAPAPNKLRPSVPVNEATNIIVRRWDWGIYADLETREPEAVVPERSEGTT